MPAIGTTWGTNTWDVDAWGSDTWGSAPLPPSDEFYICFQLPSSEIVQFVLDVTSSDPEESQQTTWTLQSNEVLKFVLEAHDHASC
jgi:hypothetical protein